MAKTFHSVCRWTFHAGKGGFTPSNQRPAWGSDEFDTIDMIKLVKKEIVPRIPDIDFINVKTGFD